MSTIDTARLRATAKLWGSNYALMTGHEIVALCDALDAAQKENAEILAANDELGEMFDLEPLKRASSEQLWAELDLRCAPYAESQEVADLLRERAHLYQTISRLRGQCAGGAV